MAGELEVGPGSVPISEDEAPPARRCALVIAMHFPPFARGSGYRRTLNFCEHLPLFGWDPVVLTMQPRAFEAKQSPDEGDDYSPSFPVYRAFAIDAARHLAIRGRHPALFAVPDRWASWLPHATWLARKIIRRHRPDVIFTTYPIATAHLVGLVLHRATGIPWVADFRDPMVDESYPRTPLLRKTRTWIESRTIRHCSAAVFTTPAARDMYASRYADTRASLSVVYNGYNEHDFQAIATPDASSSSGRRLTLVHSGVLYRDVRDPTYLFRALARLKNRAAIGSETFRVVLRASGSVGHYREMLIAHGIDDIVELAPAIPYREALSEMMDADGLLLIQAKAANRQVPAKLFEYLRAGRPIIALVDREGDTARILRELGVGRLAQIDSELEVLEMLEELLSPESRATWCSPRHVAEAFSRRASTEALARVLDSVALGASSTREGQEHRGR